MALIPVRRIFRAIIVFATIAILVFVYFGWTSAPRSEGSRIERPKLDDRAHGRRIERPTRADPDRSAVVRPESCENDRMSLELATMAARDLCDLELRDIGCFPPVAFPDGAPGPEYWAAQRLSMFTDCPEALDDTLLDCTEFPCLLLASRDLLSSSECEIVRELAAVAQPTHEIAHLGSAWEAWAAFSTVDMPDPTGGELPSRVHARSEARMGRLAERLDRLRENVAPYPRMLEVSTCDEVRSQLHALEGSQPCAALEAAWGCTVRTGREVPSALADEHVRLAQKEIAQLEHDCGPFLEVANYTLDCGSLPCVLAFVPPDELEGSEYVCARPSLTERKLRKRRPEDPMVVFVPVWNEPTTYDPAFRERWHTEQGMRMARLMDELVGAPRSPDEVELRP